MKDYHFNACDAAVLKELPFGVRQRLPALITHKAAIESSVMEALSRDLVNGRSFQDAQTA